MDEMPYYRSQARVDSGLTTLTVIWDSILGTFNKELNFIVTFFKSVENPTTNEFIAKTPIFYWNSYQKK